MRSTSGSAGRPRRLGCGVWAPSEALAFSGSEASSGVSNRLGRLKDRDSLPVRRPVEGNDERESGAQPAGVDPVDPGMQPGTFVELDQPGDGAWGGCASRRAVMDDGPARESSGAPSGFPG